MTSQPHIDKSRVGDRPSADALYVACFRRMVLIRRFEETVHSLFLRGEVYGSTHLCNGQRP